MKTDSLRRHKPPDPVSTKRGQAQGFELCALKLNGERAVRIPAESTVEGLRFVLETMQARGTTTYFELVAEAPASGGGM